MTIVYIAGPMTGIDDFNYPAFNVAAERLTALGYDVLNPADSEKENLSDEPQSWDWYMRRALAMVLKADRVALLPGWENSPGAQLEVQVANALLMEVTDLEDLFPHAEKVLL